MPFIILTISFWFYEGAIGIALWLGLRLIRAAVQPILKRRRERLATLNSVPAFLRHVTG